MNLLVVPRPFLHSSSVIVRAGSGAAIMGVGEAVDSTGAVRDGWVASRAYDAAGPTVSCGN
jgi:hypothetical protein